MADPDKEFGIIFCGGGPAACGPLLWAAHTNCLERLLDKGILIIEARESLGGGSLGNYRVNSNSAGEVFTRRFRAGDSPIRNWLDDKSILTDELCKQETPALETVGAFLDGLGSVLERIVKAHPKCRILKRTHVRSIKLRPDGGVSISAAREENSSSLEHFLSRTAVIAMGGAPRNDYLGLDVQGIGIAEFHEKVLHAGSVLDARDTSTLFRLRSLPKDAHIVIIGGSHSAWSVAWILTSTSSIFADLNFKITLAHRSAIRLLYKSQKEALVDGYQFDRDIDVCSRSGSVNRFGGLMGNAHPLARASIGIKDLPSPALVTLHPLSSAEPAHSVLKTRHLLEQADLIVVATGFEQKLPVLFDEEGSFLHLRRDKTGLVINEFGQVTRNDGRLVTELVSYGLGSGFSTSPVIGGERSFQGRIDSVWLYQNDIGAAILRGLLDD